MSPIYNASRGFGSSSWRWFLLILLAFGATALHGYHPYVVDASIYVTGIEKSIDPTLFMRDGDFVSSHARLSAFSFLMARLQSATGAPLPVLLLLTYLALVFCFLAACHATGRRVFGGEAAGWGSALLMTACLPLPVAATSLLMVDPYLTARSFSTPLTLLAVLSCIEHRWVAAGAAGLLTTIFHPLMGIYLAGFVLTYLLVSASRWRTLALAACGVSLACAGLEAFDRHTPVVDSYREAVLSRSYYFPTVWHWFEIAGLVAPLLLFAVVAWRAGLGTKLGRLACTSVYVGALCTVCCVCLVHPGGPYLLARLQLLRSFHTIYVLGTILLGGAVASRTPRRMRGIALAGLACIMAGMCTLQRQTYRSLPNVELPGAATANPWEQSYLWIRDNTPPDAFFAMDPALGRWDDEAMPGFRAMTRRSILLDVKDEGLASLFPRLAPEWYERRRMQENLGRLDDASRVRRLAPGGVNWLLLDSSAATNLPCPYHNALLKVCSLGNH